MLDKKKAEEVFAAKKVINGVDTMTFNLLPLKYAWAYELYRNMKANHWEPEDIPMNVDIAQWRSTDQLTDSDRWIIRMGIGYFSAAEGIVGDNILHVIREVVTAPELKLVLGRHAHEENIHADSLLYMISSLGIDPHLSTYKMYNMHVHSLRYKVYGVRIVIQSTECPEDIST